MAQVSSLFSRLPPPAIFLFELLAGSTVIGCTSSRSVYRLGAVPLLASCVYGIVTTAGQHMRPRWASLLGGTSVAFFLQFVDLALVSRWNMKDQGPARNTRTQPESNGTTYKQDTLWSRICFGWNAMWAFRHVNSPYEVKNVPLFSNSDPAYVPDKWRYVAQRVAISVTCYLVLDLLALRKPPTNNTINVFDPRFIPMITRMGDITLPEVKRKALMMTGFAATFYSLIQGAQSACAAVAVALGLSKAQNWRPAFGSFSDAYSLRNVWGKFWHQLLRRPLTGPASAFVHDILRLPRRSIPAGLMTLFLTFTLSASLHAAAGLSSGAPSVEFGVFQFFWTQALGIAFEEAVRSLALRARAGKAFGKKTCWALRATGYLWVGAFLTWSGPAWLYPQTARPSRPGPSTFLPVSLIQLFLRNNSS